MNRSTIKNVIVALVLGALGSGLWSLAGQPLLNWFIDTFISLAQTLNNGYYNLLHENIGKGFHEMYSLTWMFIVTMILALAYIALPIYSYSLINKEKSNPSDDNERKEEKKSISSKQLFAITLIASFVFLPYYISAIVVEDYNNKSIVFVERSIDILSPYIEQKEVLFLRSNYRAISDANSFYQLHDKLSQLAVTNEIQLPEFDIAK